MTPLQQTKQGFDTFRSVPPPVDEVEERRCCLDDVAVVGVEAAEADGVKAAFTVVVVAEMRFCRAAERDEAVDVVGVDVAVVA